MCSCVHVYVSVRVLVCTCASVCAYLWAHVLGLSVNKGGPSRHHNVRVLSPKVIRIIESGGNTGSERKGNRSWKAVAGLAAPLVRCSVYG